MERSFPSVMATQHPDSAGKYVPVQMEPEEAIECLLPQRNGGFGCDEYMVDYEGKLTPYHQVSQVVLKALEKGLDLCESVFVTPRAPSVNQENVFRQLMVLLAIKEANFEALRRSGKLGVLEVIHPMTESPTELIDFRRRINELTEWIRKEVDLRLDPSRFHIIPLIEGVPELLSIPWILREFLIGCNQLGVKPPYLRVFVGRSDSAMLYGHLPSVLACKLAVSEIHALGEEFSIPTGPILGAGALPFRGHVTPGNIGNVLKEYPGIRTLTIQSALRYDHEPEECRRLINIVKEKIPQTQAIDYVSDEKDLLVSIIGIFTKHYWETLHQAARVMDKVADLIPRRRDRLIAKGSFSYVRHVPRTRELVKIFREHGEVGRNIAKEIVRYRFEHFEGFPRAIAFTFAFYTVGIPPELIGTGRGLMETGEKLGEKTLEDLITRYYPSLRLDLEFAFRFLHLDIAEKIFPPSVMKNIRKDVEYLSDFFGLPLNNEENGEYRLLIESALPSLLDMITSRNTRPKQPFFDDLIIKMGKIRRSLG